MLKKFLLVTAFILFLVLVYFGILGYYPSNVITIDKAESLLADCKLGSLGESHKHISRYFDVGVKENGEELKWHIVNIKYKDGFYQKVENMNKSGQCPNIPVWIE